MHYDVTLHDLTTIISQIYTAYRNSLFIYFLFYLFQVRSMRSDSWVWREVKEREEKNIKEGDTRGPIPTLPHAIFPAHIFLIVPRPHNLSQHLE